MRLLVFIFVVAVSSTSDGEPARTHWIRANFHAHAQSGLVGDDGSEPPAELHRQVALHGFDFSVHSAHSTLNTGAEAPERFAEERDKEAKLGLSATTVLGEELTVAPGPNYQKKTQILGHNAPGNLEHLSIFGMQSFVPSGTPMAEACKQVHAEGGLCLVNHPGPGPMMWEDGLWEAPQNRPFVDGLEVYNGQAIASVGLDFEARYREATAYSGLGMHIAAVTGADTHGPKSVERARRNLAGLGAAAKLLKLMMPGHTSSRPELDAMTLVAAASKSVEDVIAAVKARHTVATYAMGNLTVELPGLGEVKPTGDVELHLKLSRKLAEVTLYREGTPVRTWNDVKEVDWNETVTTRTAYVFNARDGAGRLTTSAVWYEPPKK